MADKQRLIRQITAAGNYQGHIGELYHLPDLQPRHGVRNTVFTANYQREDGYERQHYKTYKQDYRPVWDVVFVSKTGNQLIYTRTVDRT